MKVLVIGYGSMGRRRIRLISSMVEEPEFLCVDSNPNRVDEIKQAGISAYDNLDEAVKEKPDIAFVCTSPGSHAEIIMQLVGAGIPVFTELNLLANQYEEIIETAKGKNVPVFMSSTMLYNGQIKNIDHIVKGTTKPVTYVYHIGQYLPDWHPWESYKDFFVGRKKTDGVREIYAIQLPWIINTFGKIVNVSTVQQKCTELDIDFSDSVIASFIHENGNIGIFAADVVSRKATTFLEVIAEDFHLTWRGHNDDLFLYDPIEKKEQVLSAYNDALHQEGYADNIIENQYIDEIQDFLGMVFSHTEPRYSLEKDAYTLSIIDRMIEGGTR